MQIRFEVTGLFCTLLVLRVPAAQSPDPTLARDQWGAPPINVGHAAGK